MRMTLTTSHALRGKPRSGIACPVALLLFEKTGLRWGVGTFHCSPLDGPMREVRIEFPEIVSLFIQAFDMVSPYLSPLTSVGRYLPLEFDLEIDHLLTSSPDPHSDPPIETPAPAEEPEEVLV